MSGLQNSFLVALLIAVLIQGITLRYTEASVINGNRLVSQPISPQTKQGIYKEHFSRDFINGDEPVTIMKNSRNHIRPKRSPYPPGFVIWSAPSEAIPCNCSPGRRKCKCLGLLERIVSLGKHRRIIVRRRA